MAFPGEDCGLRRESGDDRVIGCADRLALEGCADETTVSASIGGVVVRVGTLVVLLGLVVSMPVSGAQVATTPEDSQPANLSYEIAKSVYEGATALQSGNFKSALEYFKTADTLAGGLSWDAVAGAASASLQLGKVSQALEYVERMLEIDQTPKRRGIAYQLMGSCFAEKNKLSDAEASLRDAVDLLPGRPIGTRTALAKVLCRQKKEEEALQFLDDDGLCEQKHNTVVDPSEPGRPIRWKLGGPVTEPVKLSGTVPPYPEVARRARIQGLVVMGAIIGKDGNVRCLRVLDGLSHGLNCSAALSLINWKFSPATIEGDPIDVYYIISVRFGIS